MAPTRFFEGRSRIDPLLALLLFAPLGACLDLGPAGSTPDDRDGDGTPNELDCAPFDPDIHPGAPDPWGDRIDQNCDGTDGVDADGDGFPAEGPAPWWSRDCDDTDATVHPGVFDPTASPEDRDCDGTPFTGVLGAYQAVTGIRSAAVWSVGDVDGDGFDDLMVNRGTTTGSYLVLFGGADLSPGLPLHLLDALATIGPLRGIDMHMPHPAAGDLDGDGLADLILPVQDTGPRLDGVFLGRSLAAGGLFSVDDADAVVPSEQGGSRLRGVGDIDGDGFDDLGLLGSLQPSEGLELWVLPGSADLSTELGPDQARAVILLDSPACAESFGPAGDVDGDGLGDLLLGVGESCALDALGAVVRGDALEDGAALAVEDLDIVLTARVWDWGDDDATPTGWLMRAPWVLAAGDLTGDGRDDVLALLEVDEGAANTSEYRGGAYLWAGVDLADGGTFGLSQAARSVRGEGPGARAGRFATLGDLDGDGRQDLVLASFAPSDDLGQDYGAARISILLGSTWSAPGPTVLTAADSTLMDSPAADSDLLFLTIDAGGDLNGDGRSDLLATILDPSREPIYRVIVYMGGPF